MHEHTNLNVKNADKNLLKHNTVTHVNSKWIIALSGMADFKIKSFVWNWTKSS